MLSASFHRIKPLLQQFQARGHQAMRARSPTSRQPASHARPQQTADAPSSPPPAGRCSRGRGRQMHLHRRRRGQRQGPFHAPRPCANPIEPHPKHGKHFTLSGIVVKLLGALGFFPTVDYLQTSGQIQLGPKFSAEWYLLFRRNTRPGQECMPALEGRCRRRATERDEMVTNCLLLAEP